MKIAVSATGPGLDAQVDPRFGRCQHFFIVDPESMDCQSLDNSGAMAAGGAGVSTAQIIAERGAEVVLTGNCGPNAYQALSAAGIQVITGVSGRIKDALEDYKAGKLQASTQPNVSSHYGMGMGRGMDGGTGRRMRPRTIPQAPPQATSPEQEIQVLKSEIRRMTEKLGEIQRRIDHLGKAS